AATAVRRLCRRVGRRRLPAGAAAVWDDRRAGRDRPVPDEFLAAGRRPAGAFLQPRTLPAGALVVRALRRTHGAPLTTMVGSLRRQQRARGLRRAVQRIGAGRGGGGAGRATHSSVAVAGARPRLDPAGG